MIGQRFLPSHNSQQRTVIGKLEKTAAFGELAEATEPACSVSTVLAVVRVPRYLLNGPNSFQSYAKRRAPALHVGEALAKVGGGGHDGQVCVHRSSTGALPHHGLVLLTPPAARPARDPTSTITGLFCTPGVPAPRGPGRLLRGARANHQRGPEHLAETGHPAHCGYSASRRRQQPSPLGSVQLPITVSTDTQFHSFTVTQFHTVSQFHRQADTQRANESRRYPHIKHTPCWHQPMQAGTA